MTTQTALHPRLIVSDPDTALAYYQKALGAAVIERFTDDQDRVVHAAFTVEGAYVSLAQYVPEWGLKDPVSLNGSPCLLHLTVTDPDKIAEQMVREGGKIIIEIADRPYGKREGRVADPFGHLWILSKTIEDIDNEEIARRLRGN